jgi:hypothetical protein
VRPQGSAAGVRWRYGVSCPWRRASGDSGPGVPRILFFRINRSLTDSGRAQSARIPRPRRPMLSPASAGRKPQPSTAVNSASGETSESSPWSNPTADAPFRKEARPSQPTPEADVERTCAAKPAHQERAAELRHQTVRARSTAEPGSERDQIKADRVLSFVS